MMRKPIKHIRLVSPSRSYADQDLVKVAKLTSQMEEALGIRLSWGKAAGPVAFPQSFSPVYMGATPQQRLEELHEAFEDDTVDALWSVKGGDAMSDMIRLLNNYTPATPKPIFGMSDNTTILNWLYNKTGVVGYYSPVFNDFKKNPGKQTVASMRRIIQGGTSWEMGASLEFFDFIAASPPKACRSDGVWIIQEGELKDAKMMLGLLRNQIRHAALGWLPSLEDMLLGIDVLNCDPVRFSADLETLLSLSGSDKISGLLIGRMPEQVNMTRELLTQIIATKEELKGKPVVANLDFGHTYPITTIPFVSRANLVAKPGAFSLTGDIA